MITVLDAAKYLAIKYKRLYGEDISEMKLHKMLYFAQRESLVEYDSPLFPEEFQGWRFGPVVPEVRYMYPEIIHSSMARVDHSSRTVLDKVVAKYGEKDAWSLSRLTHGEYSWQASRRGVGDYENSTRPMLVKDIEIDAKRIKDRREMLRKLQGEN